MKEQSPPTMEPGGLTAPPAPKHTLPKLPPAKAPEHRSGWRWLWLPVLALLALGVWRYGPKASALLAPTPPPAKGGKKGGSGVVPVVAAKAWRGNIPVIITGLGSVTPIYTDVVKSRVDGQLMQVHYHEGDLVHQGDLLLEIDPRPYQVMLDQAEGQLIRDQATLDNAHVDLDRYTKLLAQNAIPEQQLATQKALVKQYEGVVKTDQAQIDNAKLDLVYCNITAPITGRVGLRLVDPGNIVHATDTNGLVVITQIDPISVIFTVAEDDLPVVLKKLAGGEHLVTEAWDRNNISKIGTGTLETVDNQIDPTTGSLRLRANFDNKANQLFPNQFVNVKLLVQTKAGVVLVPTAVIQRTTAATFVYAVQENHRVTVRQVTLGVTEGDNTEVTSGVEPGDVLVMTGVDKLAENTPVTVEMADGQSSATTHASSGSQSASKSGGKKK
jgi:membrane fusion protein, multidrug efflux system